MAWMNSYIGRLLCIAFCCCFSAIGSTEPFALEGKEGVFIPSSKKMRNIFQIALPLIEIEGSYEFSSAWDIWAGIGYIFAKGEPISWSATTTMNIIPFTLGIKHFFLLASRTDAFLGFGGLWSLYKNRDCSPSVHQHISTNAFGAVVTVGLQHCLSESLSMNFFGEYMYQHFNFSRVYREHFTYRHDVDMSGTKIGLGLAYSF